jgi:arylsulfatase
MKKIAWYPLLGFSTISITSLNYSCSGQKSFTGSEKSQPNIVLIFADDLGYGDVGVFGATGYSTPNLDKMAGQGMKFSNFLVSAAVCSASRAALMTGCYNLRVGINGALSPKVTTGINADEELIPELLKRAGYRSIAIGKWHLGHHKEFLPVNHGFDEYLGIPYSNDMWPLNYDNKRVSPDEKTAKATYPELPLIHNEEKIGEFLTIGDQEKITTLYTEKALEFIRNNRENPFFLYLAHSMPHVPLAVSDKFRGKSEQGLFGDVIMEIDWSVGEILRVLEENGLTDNTLVIFTSDNGPWLNFGNHAGSAGGLREGKGTTFEGGQRVACIMKWPGVIPEGTVCSKLASTIDLLPTFSAITGAPLPQNKIDGTDISALLKNDPEANPREVFYYYTANSLEAVRWQNWKLVFPHKGRSYEGFAPGRDGLQGEVSPNFPYSAGLYDLRRDPGERYNLMEYYPEMVEKLEKIADEARKDLGDNLTGVPGANRREPGKVNP